MMYIYEPYCIPQPILQKMLGTQTGVEVMVMVVGDIMVSIHYYNC